MFLVVFVTLVISIIGLYAQVLSLQTAKIANAQLGLMQTMASWHSSATQLGMKLPAASLNGMSGCLLTATGYTAASILPAAACPLTLTGTSLPPSYNTTSYSFYSIAFQSSAPSGAYVITYVLTDAADEDATGSLKLPDRGGVAIGYTASNLLRQLTNGAPTYLSYGNVTATGTLTIAPRSNVALGMTQPQLTYTIPTTIPVGSIAMISAAQ